MSRPRSLISYRLRFHSLLQRWSRYRLWNAESWINRKRPRSCRHCPSPPPPRRVLLRFWSNHSIAKKNWQTIYSMSPCTLHLMSVASILTYILFGTGVTDEVPALSTKSHANVLFSFPACALFSVISYIIVLSEGGWGVRMTV